MYRKDKKDEFYTRLAKKEGYPARSVYKLKEIDQKYNIIKKNDKVLDLGSAPGSWLMYIAEKAGERGRAVGIDIEQIKISVKNNAVFIKRDILGLSDEDIKNLGGPFDIIVADLAPSTSGVISVDVGRSLELGQMAFYIVKKALKTGGNFVCKIFEGEGSDEFIKEVEKDFKILKRARPKAVIKHSKEFYIVAKGYGKF